MRLSGAVAVLALLLGCASAPRPKVLDDASHLVNRSEAGELEALRPKLVKQAREYLTQAEDAYERGDLEATGLYAHMAIQRFETASNYVARDSALALAKVMDKSRQEAAERQEELERFRTLEARIAALDADLLSAANKDSAEVREAKSALLEARRKQAEAIGAGAPTYAPEKYEEGRSLVETGLESLELAMYSDSVKTSNRAIVKLDEAIAQARTKKTASVAVLDATPSDANSDLAKAQSVINDAASAQASAIAQRAPEKNPALYNQGESLLHSAEQRLRDGDYKGAVRHAEDSIAAFRRSMTERSPELTDAAGAIRAAEDARSDAIGRGASSEDLAGGDFLLSTARRALEDGDSSRAKDKAREARAAYVSAGGTSVRAGRMAAAGSDSVSKLAEAKIIALKFQRAELLGQNIDQSCGGPYREFEAILQLASDRLEAGDGPRAYEFAIRAEERVRACDPNRPGAPADKAEAAKAEIARSKAAAEIRKAQQSLAAARARSPNDDSLQQPASLIDNAERWYTRKAYGEAETLAKEASAVLTRLRTAPPPAAAKGPTTQADTADLAKTKAAVAIQKAQEAHAKASARDADDASTKQAGLLIGAAERWFEQAVYPRAETLANKALAELGKPAGPAPKKGTTASQTELGAVCADARTQLNEARKKDAAVKTAKLTPPQSKTQRDARALVLTADGKLKAGACTEAAALAFRAAGMLSELPGNEEKVTSVDSATKPSAARPAIKPSQADEKVTSKPPPAWKGAYDKIKHALRLRDQARASLVPEARPAYDRGDRSLGESRSHYRAKRYPQAENSASIAIAQFETALSSSGLTPAAPVASAPVTASTDPEAMAQQVIQRYESQQTGPSDGAWKTAYRDVIAALSARDMAREIAMEPDQAAMSRGEQHLGAARDAWTKKSFATAGQEANEARAAFSAVASAAAARAEAREAATQTEPTDARDKARYREADQAIREAKVTLQVCERERCDDRDFAGVAEAQAMVESAQSSFANQDYAYATQLATDAKEKFRQVLAKPRKTKPATPAATVDADQLAEQRRKADEAAREAVIARKLCERSGCARADYEAWLRAEQLISAAQAAYADERYEEAEKNANEARSLLRKTLDAAPKFTIPEGISNVTLVDDQLVVVPSITFYTGSSATKPESLSSLQNLAEVLKQNEGAVERIEVVGFTDAQGDRNKNIQISAVRARSVLNTLARLGVPRGKLTAEGRGPDNPVADNATAEGRERNRRVEVHVTLSEQR